MKNCLFMGMSIDGYIADRDGGLEWLETVPNPEQKDLGFMAFMESVDALVMGRSTYDIVLSFGIEWPYTKPVFVMSHSLDTIPEELVGKVEVIQGSPLEVVGKLHDRGYEDLYIDGGTVVQQFLAADLIDEMIITRIPILLGGGTLLFGDLSEHQVFEHVSTEVLLDELVSTCYRRKR